MSYIATLPMYDWPEVRAETLAFWNAIEQELHKEDLDANLMFPESDHEQETLWRSDQLIFGQTCWGPLSIGQSDYLQVLAQPDFSQFLGGREAYYRSAIVMRDDGEAPCEVPEQTQSNISLEKINAQRFAYNGKGSLSGFMAIQSELEAHQTSLEQTASKLTKSGSHRDSIKIIANGVADFATIDCRSWDLALKHEPAAKELKIVGWTAERLGLPYVCSKALPKSAKEKITLAIDRLNLGVA